jgi:hypothetical protein
MKLSRNIYNEYVICKFLNIIRNAIRVYLKQLREQLIQTQH